MTKSDAKHSAAHHVHAAELMTTAALLCLRHAEERAVAEAAIEAASDHLNRAVGYLDQLPDAEPEVPEVLRLPPSTPDDAYADLRRALMHPAFRTGLERVVVDYRAGAITLHHTGAHEPVTLGFLNEAASVEAA